MTRIDVIRSHQRREKLKESYPKGLPVNFKRYSLNRGLDAGFVFICDGCGVKLVVLESEIPAYVDAMWSDLDEDGKTEMASDLFAEIILSGASVGFQTPTHHDNIYCGACFVPIYKKILGDDDEY